MYLLLSIVLSQIIFSVHGELPDCLDGGIEFLEDLPRECDCFGHTCEKGKTCVISQHATLGKFTGQGWCLESAFDMFNPCPMVPTVNAPKGTAWPYIHGNSKRTDAPRIESKQHCNCNNKWFCKEGYEICSEFLGCIPRFNVEMVGRTMTRGRTEGFTQWIIYENPDDIIKETLQNNFEQYGDNVEIYNNKNNSKYDKFKFFNMSQATCDAIGQTEGMPNAWNSVATPRNPEPTKVPIPKSHDVHSIKYGRPKSLKGMDHRRYIDARSTAEIQAHLGSHVRNDLFVDYIQVNWRCTDFDYAENSFGSGTIEPIDSDLAWSTGGLTSRGALTGAKQVVNAQKTNTHLPKYVDSSCHFWDKICKSKYSAYKTVRATTGSEHSIYIYPILGEGHGPSDIYGQPDTVMPNPVREVYSDGYKGHALKAHRVKGCTQPPSNTQDVLGEPLKHNSNSECYDYWYIYGDPKEYVKTYDAELFRNKDEPYWVIAFRDGDMAKPTRLKDLKKENIVVSDNLKTMHGKSALQANSCRLGLTKDKKVYTNNDWSRHVADYTSAYLIRHKCNALFKKYSNRGCFGLCYSSTVQEFSKRSGYGYWRHIADKAKFIGKCMGWHGKTNFDYRKPNSRWTKWYVTETGSSVNEYDKGVSTSIIYQHGFREDFWSNILRDSSSSKSITYQGYIDIWKSKTPSDTSKAFLMYSPIMLNGDRATSKFARDSNWAYNQRSGRLKGFPNEKIEPKKNKIQVEGCKGVRAKYYSKCMTGYARVPNSKASHWNKGYWPHESWVYDARPMCASVEWSKQGCKAIFNLYRRELDLTAGRVISNDYVFDEATRFQFSGGATIHVKYHWQSYSLTYNLNSGTIAPRLNPYVHYNKMFENVPSKQERCYFKTTTGIWKDTEKDTFFLMDGQSSKGISSAAEESRALTDTSKWIIHNGVTNSRHQFVLKGSSFVFCENDVNATESCLCGRRACDKGEWCYYRHFTSDDWKGRSFDLVGYCSPRKIVPCEDVDPNTSFMTAWRDLKPKTEDCVCGTKPKNGDALNWDAANLDPRWIYVADGPYMTCNFDLNVYGQGNLAIEVPILSPPCRSIFGVKANTKRCACYATKEGKLTPEQADEHVHWSDYFQGQYCNRTQYDSKVESIAYALVSQGYCKDYDGSDWQVVKHPDQCLEGSNRIDDKTLTINPKVRFTRSKHDQPGCSWDKGGWYLLFNDRLPAAPDFENSLSPNYVIPCEDTYAEDSTRSGCICQLRGERCEAVHAQRQLAQADFSTHDYCLCGQKKCSEGKYCYEKLSGCKDTNSFKCNVAEDNMCWPDNAQRIITKIGARRNSIYLVEKVETTAQMTSVCPEGADGQESNNGFGNGAAASEQCICGDAFKVLPTLCDAGEYCHHRLNICYKEKQDLCPTNVFNTKLDQCLCGLKKNKPAHMMNVYDELDDATEEPHDQAKFFDTVYCERGQLCVLRDYSDSLEADASCISAPVEKCPDYPQQINISMCQCSSKAKAKKDQYCYKGEVRDELHPYCKDSFSHSGSNEFVYTNCFCSESDGNRGTMLGDNDGKYCDYRSSEPSHSCGLDNDQPCGTVRNVPNADCDLAGVILSADAENGKCKCKGKLQFTVCATGEMCGMIEGGLPKCYDQYVETCDATLSCEESLARADTCFCDGVQTDTYSICTGAGIVKNPTCDRYESPYDVVKKDVYFHNFNKLQIGTVQEVFVIEDVVYGEEYDPLAYLPGSNSKRLKRDAPDWCDPLLAFDNPDHYDCLYLPTRADMTSEISVRIEWSTENEYLIPGESSIELKTSIDNVNNEFSNCESYRVTVGANDYTTAWEASDARSTILDSFDCPSDYCFARKGSDDTCAPTLDCIQPEYEQCDLLGTSKRYFTWLEHSDVYKKDNSLQLAGYDSAYTSANVVQDTEYIESGIYTKNDLLDFSTEILMCTLEDVATKSANTVEFTTEGTTVPHAFVFAFDGECTGTELHMYEGNGDNPGTANERRNKCAKACAEKNPSLSTTSWDNVDVAGEDITGFIVNPSSGRCFCEVRASQDCTRSSGSYDRYDFIEPFYSWTEVDLEDRRGSIVVPVVDNGEQVLNCVVGLFTADVAQRKDPTPFDTTLIEKRFMGGNPSLAHFYPSAIAVDVKVVSGASDNACLSLNNEENTGWMPIRDSFHRNPCNALFDRSNTYQFAHSTDNVDRIEDQSVEYTQNDQSCVLERIYESTAEIGKMLAHGKCKYLRPLPEGWWANRLESSHQLAHSDPAEECARRCYSAYKSNAFTLKTSRGIPTWLSTHVGFESVKFSENYAGRTFWDKFNLLQQQWEVIPKATRLDQCACAYDTCDDITDELNMMPLYKTDHIDPCFETFFPIFLSIHDSDAQKLYFEKTFIREDICDLRTEKNRFSRTYYSSYTIEAKTLTIMSPHVTNIKAHGLDDKGHLATDNGGVVLQDIDFSQGWSAQNYYNNNIPKCAGDCDRDSHCASGLKCFQRSYGEPVPGCKEGGNRYLDLCYDPNDKGKPEFESVEINGFSQVEQGTSTYLAQICVKYVPWCPVITEDTRIEDINENMFECVCSTEAKKELWDPNNPFWVYERHKIYKNQPKYCLQEPDTRKISVHKKPCAAFNKTIEWSSGFDKSSLGSFQVENLQECYCGGDNGLYCSDTEFCMGDQNERVCQSLNQLIDKDVPVRVIEHGTCADMPGWEPVQDPLFCYAQRQLLLRPHGYEISTSDAQEEYTNYPDVSLLDDVKYARLGDVQDKHETDELYYGLTFDAGCSLSYISQVDEDVPFYKNAHLAPIKDPSTGEFVPITHRKYTGSWGDRCAIPGLAEWYYETTPDKYSTAYYSCDQPTEIGIWEEYTVRQNAFGTTRALPKLHSGDVNRVLGLYAKLGNGDFAAGEHTLEVNTRNVEYMQFSQIEDIPAEVYNIKYKQKKLCKLDRPLCSDVMAGNAYDSKYCIRSDGSVVDAGALQIPSGKTVTVLVQSGTCAQSAADSIETAEQCGSRATELGYSSTVDVITEASGAEPFAVVSDDARETALDYHKIFERGYPGLTPPSGTDKDSADLCADHCFISYGYTLLQSSTFCTSQVTMVYIQNSSPQACAQHCYSEGYSGFFINHADSNLPNRCKCSTDGCTSRYGSSYSADSYFVGKSKGFVFGKDGKCYCSAVKASTSSKTSDDRYTAYDFEEYAVSYAAYTAQRNDPTKASCAANGAEPITTAAECDAAGIAIGMVETSPKAGYTTLKNVNNWGPNGYCIKWRDDMYFNSHAVTDKCGHTGMLGEWSYGPCVCKTDGAKTIPQRFVYKGGGICNSALGIRVYNGANDNPGTDSKSNQIECAKACLNQKTPLANGPWSSRGDALGFSVDAVGRCYCNHKTWSGCSGSIVSANYGYSFYDFADRQVYTNPSSCPEGFYYQNGICTRLVTESKSHYCDGGAWGQYVSETNYNTINYLVDPTECATRCSEYAVSNQLGNVQKGQVLRHYASNRVQGNSKNCFCHKISHAPDGHCEDANNVVYNSYYNTLVIDTVIPDANDDYTGISNQLARSRCAQKCSRTDGFSITNDGNCLCEEEGSSTSAYVDSNSFTRYKTNEALKYVDNHLRYIKIGDGYCSDYKYLPEGGYPAFLSKTSPLFSRDRTRECMNRCLDAYPDSKAFMVQTANNKCACSSGQCQWVRPSVSYYSYKITKCVGEGRLPDYSLKYSGSCERPVTSVEECEIAAVQLGLSDANIDTGSHQNINHAGLPYGCTQNPVSGDLYLNLNQATKTCGTSSHPCICRDEPVACPPGTYAFDRGSKCCRVNSDKNGNAINFYSPHCLDDNHIDCATGGYCVDENYGCPIANENADYILDKEHLATPGADVYEVELVKENAVCADSKYQSVVAIKEQSSLTTAEMADKCKDACVHGQEAACNREPDCVNGQICQSISGHVIDNTGATMNDNAHPMRLDLSAWGGDANSLIFGEWSGNWLKMTRTNLQGVMQETRYTNSISSIGALTLSQWNAVASRSLTNVAGRTTCVSARYCVKNVKFDCVGETKRWSNFLVSQHSSQFLGDGYCLPDTSGTRKFVTDFKSCEGRCASEPNCNVFAWINANDDSRVGNSQCIINLDSTCETSADGSNDYPWKRYKINRKPSGKYYEISEGLCSDTGGENIEDVSECIQEAAHYAKDAYCTKNGGPTCNFGSNTLDVASRPSGCYWYTGSGTEAIRFNSNVNSEPASIENKRICKKRVHGFLLKDDGKCVCTTGMADASNCVNDNAFSSYKINYVAGRHSTPPGCSGAGDELNFNPFSSTATCDATNNCICTKPEYTVECPADEFPLDESESLEFCRCNGEELCSSDFAPYCLTNGKCVKNGKCIHGSALLAECEGKAGWLRHPVGARENDICEEWFGGDTESTRPEGGMKACGVLKCPRGHTFDKDLNICSNYMEDTYNTMAKLVSGTCSDVTSNMTRGHSDCQRYNIGQTSKFLKFRNVEDVNAPYGCSALIKHMNEETVYKNGLFNIYDSRQVCSIKTPCFCQVENMRSCPHNQVADENCLCGRTREIVLIGGMCRDRQAYPECFDNDQSVRMNWPCVCFDRLVSSKTYCNVVDDKAINMQFSIYGADFERRYSTCHFQDSDVYLRIPRTASMDSELMLMPNPNDRMADIMRKSGTRSAVHLTLENIMSDLNDLAESIEFKAGEYELGSKNHSFAGIYADTGLFCKNKTCHFGIPGTYGAKPIITGFECRSVDYEYTGDVVQTVKDCAAACGRNKDCWIFGYNNDTKVCKIERTGGQECLQGWTPAAVDSFRVEYEYMNEVSNTMCTDSWGKTCVKTLDLVDANNKQVHLGYANMDFKNPSMSVRGLYHTLDASSTATYYVGYEGTKSCSEEPGVICGIKSASI